MSHLKRGNYIFFKDYADLMHKYAKTAPDIHRVCMVLDFRKNIIILRENRDLYVSRVLHTLSESCIIIQYLFFSQERRGVPEPFGNP
jgi:hypothetical protein